MVTTAEPQETSIATSAENTPPITSENFLYIQRRRDFVLDLARDLYLEHCKQRQGKAPQNYALEVVRSAKELADALELED